MSKPTANVTATAAPAAKPAPAAAPAAKPAPAKGQKPYSLRAIADAVAKLGKDLRASDTPTRARVEHPNFNRLVVGFAWTGKHLQVSCPFWEKHGIKSDEKLGNYLIRHFSTATPMADVVKEVATVLKKEGLI